MDISIISFTDNGDLLNNRLSNFLGNENHIQQSLKSERTETLSEWTKAAFDSADAIIFIGACGIAVRAIAPFIKSKATDPAVVVCDELGQYTISLLSGHIGGANELTNIIAAAINAIPIITTATDINGVWAVDVWAEKQNFYIENIENIKFISGTLLKGKKVCISSDVFDKPEILFPDGLPEGVIWSADESEFDTGIFISPYLNRPYEHTLNLVPKCITVGAGSRKDADARALINLVEEVFEREKMSIHAMREVATIDIKKDEASIRSLADKYKIPFRYYSAAELNELTGFDFEASDFVYKTTGTDNVCERSAVKAANEHTDISDIKIMCRKTKGEGVTCALVSAWNE